MLYIPVWIECLIVDLKVLKYFFKKKKDTYLVSSIFNLTIIGFIFNLIDFLKSIWW